MIAFSAPLALAALAALPVLWWLDRRRRRAVPVDLPSLLFVPPTDGADAVRRSPPDLDLALALAAAALLALAGAAPVWRTTAPGRTVRVAVATSPSMGARGADGRTAVDRAEAVVDAIARALGPDDVLERADAAGRDVVAAARGGSAALRVAVSDRARPDASPDVVAVAVGDPAAENLGLVAVDVAPVADGRRVFAAVRNDAGRARRATVRVDAGPGATLELAPGATGSATFDVGPAGPDPITVRVDDPDGALSADDVVTLQAAPLVVRVAPEAEGLPRAHADLVRATLAVVAPGFLERDDGTAALRVGARPDPAARAGVDWVLSPLRDGGGVAVPPGGPFEPWPAGLGRDADPTGCDLRVAAASGPPWALARRAAGAGSAVVVTFLFDPLAGAPAPADHPLWPVLADDVVALAAGRLGPAGHRLRGLVDPDGTRLGRDVAPFDAGALARTAPDRAPRERPLRAPLVALAVGTLALLWSRSARRAVG